MIINVSTRIALGMTCALRAATAGCTGNETSAPSSTVTFRPSQQVGPIFHTAARPPLADPPAIKLRL